MPRAAAGLGQLDAIVKEAATLLGPEVLRVTYRLREDSTDVPSIFFRILLADEAFHEDTIVDLGHRISGTLLKEVRPLEDWNLRPYFNYRLKSEQDRHKKPDWE
jgi:hypothetical protein